MNKHTRRHLLILSLLVGIAIVGTLVFYYSLYPVTKQVIPVDITVGDYLGVNLDDDALHLGTIRPGSSAQRSIVLRADSSDSEIRVIVEGIPFLFPEYEVLTLKKGKSEVLRFFAVTDLFTPKKKYEGRIILLTKRL